MWSASTTGQEIRLACRNGTYRGPTSGVAAGYLQANLVALPQDVASDFLVFCQRNPKPCPLIEMLHAGVVEPHCAPGADLRCDLPGYRIYRHGKLAVETDQVLEEWRPDLVSFLLGCSFSFESALESAGIALRHVQEGINVAMFRTNRQCQPAGPFRGHLVVSMRPIKAQDVARAVEISGRFPDVHGAPVHIGAPEAIGIGDLARPDYGDAVRIEPDEVPVFWACGVTPQAVLEASGIPFCITHAPGKMFVTDLGSAPAG